MFLSSPILSASFTTFAPPVDSFTPDTWVNVAPATLADAPTRAARAVTASTLAWRHKYYAFRHARTRIERGDLAGALAYLNGPHGDYVRDRFAELAKRDDRFTPEALKPHTVTPAPVKASATLAAPTVIDPTPEDTTPRRRPSKPPVPLPRTREPSTPTKQDAGPREVAPPTKQDASSGVIVMRESMKAALKGLLRAMPTLPRDAKDRDGKKGNLGPLVRMRAVDGVLRLSSIYFPDLAPVDVTDVQIDNPAFNLITPYPEKILQILSLEPADSLGIVSIGGELVIRSSDAVYKLYTLGEDVVRSFDVPDPKVSTAEWLDSMLRSAAALADDNAEAAQKAYDARLASAKPSMRRKLAWAILKANPTHKSLAGDARAALVKVVDAKRLTKWLADHTGTVVALPELAERPADAA